MGFSLFCAKLAQDAHSRYERIMKRAFCAFLLLLLAAPALASPKVAVRLIPDRISVVPGGRLTVAVEQAIAPGWHTYWANPGDAGVATSVTWHLPPGWKAGAVQWPYPMREPTGPLMDYGYEGKVWLLVDLVAPKDAVAGGKAEIAADVRWLVCREVCIPEDAKLALTVFVEQGAPPPDAIAADAFAAARAKIPAASPWPMRTVRTDGEARLAVLAGALSGKAKPAKAEFFPSRPDVIQDGAPQKLEAFSGGVMLRLAPAKKFDGTLDGVLVLTGADASVQALSVHAPPGAPPVGEGKLGLLPALLFAFIGGLILNIMPCVLPVLAMKALAMARHAGAERNHARAEAFAYCLGAVASFVAFGLLLAMLRAGGSAIGWGFQLQEPPVVAGLALLLFAVGLNLSGAFEIGPFGAGESLTRKPGLVGAFFTGILAVAVAAPCTAPFMASAIGFGLTQGSAAILGVFASLGLGFALPFLAVGLFPALYRLLPKPGPWMGRFKKLMALPMYGASLWLVWVLARQVSRESLIMAFVAFLALGLSLWLWGAFRSGKLLAGKWVALLVVAGFAAAFFEIGLIRPEAAAPSAELPGLSEAYSAERLAELQKENRAVFVDATASWCITCMVNEEAALKRPRVRAAFREKRIVFLIADWTNRNPQITRLLEAHGRSGVPLYLYYPPGGEAAILPQILTEGEVLQAIGAP
jgi:thiol:disulfide interchange protein